MPGSELADQLDAGALEALLALGHQHVAGTGEVLLREGETADRVIFLVSGRVKVSANTRAGMTAVLGFRGRGALLGEQAALDARPRGATVTAIEPVVYVAIAASDLRRHLLAHPEVALALIAHLSARLRDADRKRAEYVAGDTTARVAARLVELAEQYGVPDGQAVRIELPLTQPELAGWSGSSLEAVAKALRALRTAGWLETGRRAITVRDLPALQRISGS